jgi:hypothetical protein
LVELLSKSEGLTLAFFFEGEDLLLALELDVSFLKLQLVEGVASWTLVASLSGKLCFFELTIGCKCSASIGRRAILYI